MIAIDPEKVLAARESVGLNVQEVVRASGLNYKTIEALEGHGENPTPERPRLETLFALARAYGCTPRAFAKDPAEWDALLIHLGLMPIPTSSHATVPAQAVS